MQLKEIRIKQLFGHFDHVIPLNSEERLTIITAPNGYGKTIVLNLLQAFYKGDISYFASVTFESIDIVFENSFIRIEQGDKIALTISLYKDESNEAKPESTFEIESISELENVSREDILQIIKTHDLNIRETPDDRWFDRNQGRLMSTKSLINRYLNYFVQTEYSLPDWFTSITTTTNVHLIRDQRLIMRHDISADNRPHHLTTKSTQITDSIERFSNQLKLKIYQCNADYSDVSKKLDSSLPSRLFSKPANSDEVDFDSLKQQLKALTDKNQRLEKLNLVAEQEQFIPDFDQISQADKKALALYVHDYSQKLAVFDDIIDRIELFTEILNNKGLAFKKVAIDPDNGFVFIDDTSGEQLALTQLSSGEQHEVVLVYELIFIAQDNSLILIDEPEISLHITWQKEFLSDIKKIIDIQNVTVIVATHSPQIINNDWDLTVELDA